jgi:hypothetical protein
MVAKISWHLDADRLSKQLPSRHPVDGLRKEAGGGLSKQEACHGDNLAEVA